MAARARLNKDLLVSSALGIADAEGLEAVTTRRLAQDHGVTPMALYRHFADKDAILASLAERLLADVALPEPAEGTPAPWYERLRELFDALVAAIRPHPAAAPLVLDRILTCEPGLELAERSLALLAEGGYSVERAAEAAGQSLCSLVAMVLAEPDATAQPDAEAAEDAARARRAALSALSPRRFPHVVAAADALSCTKDADYYARGTAMVVAGLRAWPGGEPAGAAAAR